jgi:transcription antitermination factor NusG
MDSEAIHSLVDKQWFALRVKSHCEKIVATSCCNKGFEELLPVYRSCRAWSDRVKLVDLPLFPGYVFCRLNPDRRLPSHTIPGVLGSVGIGKIPLAIDDAEVAAIRSAMKSGIRAEPWPFLKIGQRVRLEKGPLAGLEGLLIEVRKQQRLVLSVTLLMRSVAVEIEAQWVRPLEDCPTRYLVGTGPFEVSSTTNLE